MQTHNSQKNFLKLIKKNKKANIILSFLAILVTLDLTLIAYFSKLVLDNLNTVNFLFYLILLIKLVCLEFLLRYIYNRLIIKNTLIKEKELRNKILNNYFNNSFYELENSGSGETLNLIINDINLVAENVISFIPSFVIQISKLIFAFIIIFIINYKIALISLLTGIIVYLITLLLRKKQKQLYKNAQSKYDLLISFFKDIIIDSSLIKLFNAKNKIIKKASSVQDEYIKDKKILFNYDLFLQIGLVSFSRILYVLVLIYCAFEIAKGYGIGDLICMVELINQIESPFSSLSSLMQSYYLTLGSIERLEKINNEQNTLINEENDFNEEIKIDNISFSYNDKLVFENVNFTIQPGKKYAVIGESGKGKTTFLKCLMGMLNINKGNITYKNETISLHQGLFTYVPQVNKFLDGSIKENLALFTGEVDDKDVFKVLKLVNMYDKIKSLNDGIDTKIIENGSILSEGEKQRLSLARALLSSRPILILDEATSSLDEENEKQIFENLMMSDKTIIFVTHNKDNLNFAQEIIKI